MRDKGPLIELLLELAYHYKFDGRGKLSYAQAKGESDMGGLLIISLLKKNKAVACFKKQTRDIVYLAPC